jgi:glycosyltransferase involved in cell wall biosynthesis/predicted metal-dependent phosphoesterase TrpH
MSKVTARTDMHCHSTASQVSQMGVQRAVGLPECATPPQEVYALAKRRGMDFVTITDHDTISGVLEIAEQPDVFISEELSVRFRDTQAAAHVLCYGITPDDHDWLQANRDDVELCAAYLDQREIVCALAHPYYTVETPLTPAQRRRLAELFGVWEIRNGTRPWALNAPAANFIATRGGTGIAGSDDHGGVDIGRTWTEVPAAAAPLEMLAHVRAGRTGVGGTHGSAAKWAHSAVALAARVLGCGAAANRARPDPRAVMQMARGLMREAEVRDGDLGTKLCAENALELLHAWLAAIELEHLDTRALIAALQDERFDHGELYRKACRVHEQKLRLAVGRATGLGSAPEDLPESDGAVVSQAPAAKLAQAAEGLFDSCVPVIPYAAAATFLANETNRLGHQHLREERPRVAILVDGIGATHGITRVIQEIRHRGVPGFDAEVVGTDADVDRRLSCAAEAELPYSPGLRLGVPSVQSVVQALADGGFDLIHACSPGPVGVVGALVGRSVGLPLIGSHHTELVTYAGVRTGDAGLAQAMASVLGAFYAACELVLSPSRSADRALEALSVPLEKLIRWQRGVDCARFSPELRARGMFPQGSMNVLYAGRLEHEKGIALLADAFLEARREEPSVRLILAGGGTGEPYLRGRLGEAATFLGWLHGAELARAYASADLLVFPSATDTFGQVVLEAQASGLPVVAVAAGGPLELIEHRMSGLLCAPEQEPLARSVLELARSPLLRSRLAAAGLTRARQRTWERAFERLAVGYRRALGQDRASLPAQPWAGKDDDAELHEELQALSGARGAESPVASAPELVSKERLVA